MKAVAGAAAVGQEGVLDIEVAHADCGVRTFRTWPCQGALSMKTCLGIHSIH